MIPRFLWRYRWARRLRGGCWEKWDDAWHPVARWSTPREKPDMYGSGHLPEREDWRS